MNTSLSSLSTIAAINKLLEDCSAGFYVSFQRIFQNGMRDAYISKSNDPWNPASQIAYIDDLLESGINDIPGIASYLIDSYQPIPYDVFTGGFQKEKLIQHVMPRLYSSDRKKEMDAAGIYSIPCTSAYLLAFYFSFETVPEATITITEKIMGQLEISAGELWDAAREHALKNFWFSDLAKIVEDGTEDGTYEETDESQRLYVLTNLQHNLGSGLIAFQEIQELVYRELGDREYYVLPSSIHELIIARRDIGMTRAQMESVVRQVNQNVVENVNLLGSEILRYRHGAGIEIMR